MLRTIFTLGLIVAGAAPLGATAYSAKLAVPASGRFIARDIAWTCTSTGCVGVTENSRPAVLCQSLAKQAGRVDLFLADGRPLAPADLVRCNASARPAPASKVAPSVAAN
ncbi:MAG: hypothetical protein ABIW33_02950 [Sphingomicrobium sp.]